MSNTQTTIIDNNTQQVVEEAKVLASNTQGEKKNILVRLIEWIMGIASDLVRKQSLRITLFGREFIIGKIKDGEWGIQYRVIKTGKCYALSNLTLVDMWNWLKSKWVQMGEGLNA